MIQCLAQGHFDMAYGCWRIKSRDLVVDLASVGNGQYFCGFRVGSAEWISGQRDIWANRLLLTLKNLRHEDGVKVERRRTRPEYFTSSHAVHSTTLRE